jgi:hypothetical protein
MLSVLLALDGWRVGVLCGGVLAIAIGLYECPVPPDSYTRHREDNKNSLSHSFETEQVGIYTLARQIQGESNNSPIGAILIELRVFSVQGVYSKDRGQFLAPEIPQPIRAYSPMK